MNSATWWVIVPALFWGNARTSREYLSEYSVSAGTASDAVVSFYLPEIGMVSNVNPLAPDTIHTVVKMITDGRYVGPRVVKLGVRTLRKANRLRNTDAEGCGAVIALMIFGFMTLGASIVSWRKSIEAAFNGVDPLSFFDGCA